MVKLIEIIDVSEKYGEEYNVWLQSLIIHVNQYWRGENQNFAKDAGVSKSFLSEILDGKKVPRPGKKSKINSAILRKTNAPIQTRASPIHEKDKLDILIDLMRQMIDKCDKIESALVGRMDLMQTDVDSLMYHHRHLLEKQKKKAAM